MSPQNARIPKRQVNVVQENPAAQELQRQLVALRLHGALSKLCTAIKLTNTLSLGRALRLWINKLRLFKSSIPAIVEDPVPAEVAVLTRAISGCRHKLRLQSVFRIIQHMLDFHRRYSLIVMSRGFRKWKIGTQAIYLIDLRMCILARQLRQIFKTQQVNRKRSCFARWKLQATLKQILDAANSDYLDLQKSLTVTNMEKQRVHDKFKTACKVMADKLRKAELRYGRDKLLSVLSQRCKWNIRLVFERWQLRCSWKKQEDFIRRSRLKVQVGLDQVRSERLSYEQAKMERTSLRKNYVMYAAMQEWKVSCQRTKWDETIDMMAQERGHLLVELKKLHAHIHQVKSAEARICQAARARGDVLMNAISSQSQ